MSETPISTDDPTPAAPAPRRPFWRRRPVQLGAAAVVIAAAVGGYFAASGGSTPQVHVRGTLQLGPLGAVDSVTPSAAKDGDACEAGQGYSDITAGAAVTVGGANGQTLAVGPLSAGVESNVDSTSFSMPLGDCVFSFDVSVPQQSAYTVTISHRGTQTFTPDQVAAGIRLTLGQ